MNSFFYNLSQVKIKLFQGARLLYNSGWLPWIIIAIGIILRLLQYMDNNSLWYDESKLALNIINKSLSELLKPLEHNQVTPFGFLVTEKLLVQSFGNNEYLLRLFPFVCGIMSLFLFYRVAMYIINREAVIIALGLFALSGFLIRYSTQVKQYSSDVAVTLILYIIAILLQSQGFKIRHIVIFGVIGTVAIWFSHPSVFVLAGIGISFFCFFLVKRD